MLSTSSNFRALLDLIGAAATVVHAGVGSPEGSEIGNIGDIYARLDGGPGNSLYLKVAGNGLNTGWVPGGPALEADLTAQTTPPTSTFTLGAKAFHNPSIQVVMEVYLNGQQQVRGAGADYTVSESGGPGTGYDTISFTFTPRAGDRLLVFYLPL